MKTRPCVLEALLALALLSLSACDAQVTIERNHEELDARLGDQVDLVCTGNIDKQSCTFVTPRGQTLNIYDGVRYLDGRVVANQKSPRECGITINSVQDEDNGDWQCSIGAVDNNNYISGERKIAVTVAIPPENIYMRVNGEVISEDEIVVSKKDDNKEVEVECVAEGARPRPTFKWFIGDNTADVDAHFEDLEENMSQDGKGTYIQKMRYYAAAKHNGKTLRCVVQHPGYSHIQTDSRENVVEKYLQVHFKPQSKNKEENFYGLHEGMPTSIKVRFEANPKPNNAHWTMYGLDDVVVIGAESLDGMYKSSFIEDEEADSEYSVTLEIKKVTKELAGKVNKLIVTNDQGTMEYPFKLELGDKPPAESMGSGPVVGVVVIVIIVLIVVILLVVARSKGILCFAPKNSEQLQEEKDTAAFDNVEKGGQEPLNPKTGDDPKPTPDKKADDAEDKKSNGAHTPV